MRIPFPGQMALAAGLGFSSVWLVMNPPDLNAVSSFLQGNITSPNCAIKGNVSINSGDKIYHLPGQEFYTQTRIDPRFGERWFCSEAEARAAGWRRARR